MMTKEKCKTSYRDEDRTCRPPGIFNGDGIQTEMKQNVTEKAERVYTFYFD